MNQIIGSISLKDVGYRYPRPNLSADEVAAQADSTPDLEHISLDIEPGSVVLLCGPSGCGKSTLLRTMNGLVPKFHEGTLDGSVTVSGTDLETLELHDMGHHSATVFQNPRTQFFTPFVRSEMVLTGENYGQDPDEIMASALRAAQVTGTSQFLTRKLATLSGGELQRVACACALCNDVPVLLFDEPTSNLSPSAIKEFRELLFTLKQQGHTMVIAEHRIHFLRDLVDRVYRVSDGHIVEEFSGTDFFALTSEECFTRGLRALTPPQVELPKPPQTDGTKSLVIENLKFAYNRAKPILDIERLEFPTEAVTVLAGPNGAGKSTLANLICGLLDAGRSATFNFCGKKLGRRGRNRACSIVMQDVRRQLFSESVAGEVTLGLSKQRAETIDVAAALDAMELTDFAERHPLALSGGQQQRLVISSCIASGKEILIFDEPTSGVDLRHLLRIAKQIRELAAAGAAVIVITHDPELIEQCGDYIVELPRLSDSPTAV